jgi:hypothetical protein
LRFAILIQLSRPSFTENIRACVQADELNSDVELNSSSASEDNIERLSEHACEISDGEADEERKSKEISPGFALIKMATDGMLAVYIAGALLPKMFQTVKENPNL